MIRWANLAGVSCASLVLGGAVLSAGPYSKPESDPANPHDAPIPGFVGPHGPGMARVQSGINEFYDPIFINPRNFVNPLFFGWANQIIDYSPAGVIAPAFRDPSMALGPVTGEAMVDVVSLGDLDAAALAAGDSPGSLTLTFPKPIKNLSGADFVVFENGFLAQSNQGGAGVGGGFAELAYVEASMDGVSFRRFPATSLTPTPVGAYGTIDPTAVHNLAGKHSNAYGKSWGTPFDLSAVGLAEARYVRIVDIPGSGDFKDSAGRPIYDAWPTWGSGGFDLEAVGAISVEMSYPEWPSLTLLPSHQRGENDDPDGDGIPNLVEYATGGVPWIPDASSRSGLLTVDRAGEIPHAVFSFTRDERLSDLRYEIQSSPDALRWETLAAGEAGARLAPAPEIPAIIRETSATEIASVGVLRRVTLSLPAAGRAFFRLKVSRISVP